MTFGFASCTDNFQRWGWDNLVGDDLRQPPHAWRHHQQEKQDWMFYWQYQFKYIFDIPIRTNKVEILFVTNNAATSTGWSINWTAASGLEHLMIKKGHFVVLHSSGLPPPPPTSSSSPTCPTTSGSDPNSECSFPFIFWGVTWTGCTTVDGDPRPWCATETDAFGHPITDGDGTFSAWGYCHASCPIDQGLRIILVF